MAFIPSLNSGASGLSAYSRAMSVVGSNIANVNTVGFKANQVSFEDILASDVLNTPGDGRLSNGVSIANVKSDFAQGTFEQTNSSTDMAINGEGFFSVQDQFGKTFYTRAGEFEFNKEGILSTTRGLKVLVKDVDPITGEATGPARSLQAIGVIDPPKSTGNGALGSGIIVSANLNANARVIERPFDPTNVQPDMYNFATTTTVYDDLGTEHTATIAFRKRPDIPPTQDAQGNITPGIKNQWEWYVLFDGADINLRPGQMSAVGGGYLQFGDDGRLLQASSGQFIQPPEQVDPVTQLPIPGTGGPPILQPSPVNPETGLPQVTVDFGADAPLVMGVNLGLGSNPNDPTDERTGLEGVTQFSSQSKVNRIIADGHPSGSFEDFTMDVTGTITGHFDSGHHRPMGKLVLTKFDNANRLAKVGENLFAHTMEAGAIIEGQAGIGGFGTARNQMLEQSNVDLSKEFVNMIESQRAFQANSKTVSTSDEMLQDMINLKR